MIYLRFRLRAGNLILRSVGITVLFLTVCIFIQPIALSAFAQMRVPLLRFVALTDQGIRIFERTATGNLQPVGEPFSDFAIESYGGSAEWMILGSESFAVSPDGQRIAFTARRGGEAALFVYAISDASLLQRSIVSYWLLPTWSADNGAILLKLGFPYFGPDPAPENYVYDLLTDELTQITHITTFIESVFEWTSDGQALVYLGGCELDSCEGRTSSDFYKVNHDGTNRVPLTDFTSQLPPRSVVCLPTWSPSDQHWYYVVGCGNSLDFYSAFAYSVDLSGNNRLELNLEDYVRATDGAGLTFQYGLIKGIHTRPEGIYFSVEVGFYPDVDLRPEMENVLLTEWRVLRLSSPGEIVTVYQQPTSSIGSVGLTGSVISPNGQRMAMLFNFDSAYVVDIANNQNIGAIPGLTSPAREAVCDVRWIDNDNLVYNVGARICDIVTLTTPQGAHTMDVTTGAVTSLTDGVSDPAWVLPIPEVESSAQMQP